MDRSSRRRYRAAIAELHLRGVLALFLMLAVAALVAAVHPGLAALGPVAFLPLVGTGRTGAYLTVPTYTLQGDVSARASALDQLNAAAMALAPFAGSIEDALRVFELRAASGAPTANSVIDKLNTMNAKLPAGSWSTQYGTITLNNQLTATATISSVDTTRSVVFLLGASEGIAGGSVGCLGRVALTNSTTVTATTVAQSVGSYTVSFVVLIFSTAVTSIQTGTTTLPTSTVSTTTTISAVTASRALIAFGGCTADGNNDAMGFATITLTNATTLTVARNSAGADGNAIVAWAVVNF